MAQDDYYYEIQLTNKQLVFYFMAGATGLILSFLAGVMVGRGVDTSGADVQASRPVVEERVVAEDGPKAAAPPSPADLTYAQRLESEKTDDALERPKPGATASAPAGKGAPGPVSEKAPVRTAAAVPAPALSRSAPAPVEPAGKGFTVQVGAFKDKATADSVVSRLKGKGFAAYVMSPGATEGALFVVRVGSYPQRTDAERVETKLRDQEKFHPYIVKN